MSKDNLEKDYFYYVKMFDSGVCARYAAPKELKLLGDILKYRRMKEKLDGKDVDKIANELLRRVEETILDLKNL